MLEVPHLLLVILAGIAVMVAVAAMVVAITAAVKVTAAAETATGVAQALEATAAMEDRVELMEASDKETQAILETLMVAATPMVLHRLAQVAPERLTVAAKAAGMREAISDYTERERKL